ncbi:hypothetical protein HY633_03840, partial [Candidatus Uhrbacteria bacterium]|nr:hypothetical protein [Candidatus Uhrbacteria bacterium]
LARLEVRAAATPAACAREVIEKFAMAVRPDAAGAEAVADDGTRPAARLAKSALRDAHRLGLLAVSPEVLAGLSPVAADADTPPPADTGDVEMLAWSTVFWREIEASSRLHALALSSERQAAAMSGRQGEAAAAGGDAGVAVMDAHGVDHLVDRAAESYRRAVAAARAVFARPARTVAGVLAKLRIAREVEIEDGQARCGEDMRGEWIAGERTLTAAIMGDLQQLAGEE